MKQKRWLVALLSLAACEAFAAAPEMTLEAKVDAADTVVRAECTGTRSEWVKNRIVTRSQFTVSDDLTQKGTRQIEVTTLGGTAVHPTLKVRVIATVSEQPEVRVNDQAFLFTKRAPSGENVLVGGEQGYVRIARNTNEAGERVVNSERKVRASPERDATRAQPQSRRGGRALRLESEPVSVSEYSDRVRSLMATRAQRRAARPAQ